LKAGSRGAESCPGTSSVFRQPADQFPIQVVCDWIGNTEAIAAPGVNIANLPPAVLIDSAVVEFGGELRVSIGAGIITPYSESILVDMSPP